MIFFISCKETSIENEVNVKIPFRLQEHRINGNVISSEKIIYSKAGIKYHDGYILIADRFSESGGLLHIYKDRCFKGSFISEGEGPENLSQASDIIFQGDSLIVYDSQRWKMVVANWSDFLNSDSLNFVYKESKIKETSSLPNVWLSRVNDSTFISALLTGSFPDRERFMVMNSDFDSIRTFGAYPQLDFGIREEMHWFEYGIKVLLNIFDLSFSINPYNEDLVAIQSNIHRIEIYDTKTGKLKTVISGPENDFPIRDIRMSNGKYFLPKESKETFNGIAFSKDNIFISYNGRKFNGFEESLLSRRIFVFTHDGEFLYSLNPQMDFFSFDVNEEGDKLFIIRSYEEGEAYVEFDLSEVG